MLGYYRRWLWTSIRHSYGFADFAAGAIGYGSAIVAHYWPSTAAAIDAWSWQAVLWALAVAFGFRLLLAPYWMAKEDAAKVAALESRLTPDFTMSFDPSEAEVTQDETGVIRAPNFRIYFECNGDQPVPDLRFFLTRLDKSINGGPFENQGVDPLDLVGAPLTILPGFPMPREFLRRSSDHTLAFPTWVHWPAHWTNLFEDLATYRLTLQANSGNRTRALVIEIEWHGQFDTISARNVTPAPNHS